MNPDPPTQSIDDTAPDRSTATDLIDEQIVEVEEAAPVVGRPPTVSQLRRERKRLWDLRQESLYHLGGLALDLHGRALLADELVAVRAEVIAEMDRRMAEIDVVLAEADDQRRSRRRRHRVEVVEPVGYCMSCGAPHQADAAFCFRCGARIHAPVDDADTQVIPLPDGDAR